jgi:hypothetical protein
MEEREVCKGAIKRIKAAGSHCRPPPNGPFNRD